MSTAPAFQILAGTLFASFEKNTDFRMLLLLHCKNGMMIIGISAGGLIRIMRLQRVAQLLKQNTENNSEISYKIGFNDPIYFSRIFIKNVRPKSDRFCKISRK